MKRRFTDTMLVVPVAFTASSKRRAAAIVAPSGFSTTQGIFACRSFTPISEMRSTGTTAMQTSNRSFASIAAPFSTPRLRMF
jgi:hypothetical protein